MDQDNNLPGRHRISTYKAQSNRSASTSKAAQAGTTTESILKAADLTNSLKQPDKTKDLTLAQVADYFFSVVLTQLTDIPPSDENL